MSVAVLGAGAFGTALALCFAEAGPVTLWARDGATVEALRQTRRAPRLPGAVLPGTITATGDLAEACAAEILVLAVPAQALPDLLVRMPTPRPGQPLVLACKGLNLATGQGPVAILSARAPQAQPLILTGPSFAADIARGLPTALTLAGADEATARRVQHRLSGRTLRLYTTPDTLGAELGGALKNVIAIACGACIGAGLGDSARAALMTRGFAEMTRLAIALGARPETLAGLSGLGDLALTCASEQSRNFRYGAALARGETLPPGTTVEGTATAQAVETLAKTHGLDLPVCATVAALARAEITVTEAMAALLSRPLKEETR